MKTYRKCIVDGCNNKHRSNGYCRLHHSRFYRHGDPLMSSRESHKMTDSKEYDIWICMKQRCYNKRKNRYNNYGGRGITVCDEWRNSFISFYNYMGKRPSSKHSLDRINVDGNYEPGNVRWATIHQQSSNRTNSNKVVGISYDIRNHNYRASMNVNGVTVLRKSFSRYNDAIAARKDSELKYGVCHG